MSESEAEPADPDADADADAEAEAGDAAARDESEVTGEHATRRTDERHSCRRCDREQGLVGKYEIWLCRQCFREVARDMGFKKYR